MIGIIPYNPFIIFIFAAIYNIYIITVLFNKGYTYKAILYSIVMFIIKIIPIIFLITYGYNTVEYMDINALIFFSFIYIVYIYFYKKSKLENVYNDTESNKITTPIMMFIDKIIK
jgi:hypothetical protein